MQTWLQEPFEKQNALNNRKERVLKKKVELRDIKCKSLAHTKYTSLTMSTLTQMLQHVFTFDFPVCARPS